MRFVVEIEIPAELNDGEAAVLVKNLLRQARPVPDGGPMPLIAPDGVIVGWAEYKLPRHAA